MGQSDALKNAGAGRTTPQTAGNLASHHAKSLPTGKIVARPPRPLNSRKLSGASEREVRHYKKEADSIIDALDEAERQSGQPQPESATTDYEQQEEERLRRRDETLEDWSEFDEFMQSLEIAEEKNNDPRLSRITGE